MRVVHLAGGRARRPAGRSGRRRSGRGCSTPRPGRSGSRPTGRRRLAGTDASSTLAPAALERVGRLLHPGARRRRRCPRPSARGRRRRAGRRRPRRGRRRAADAGSGIDVESSGSWPPITSSSDGGVGDGAWRTGRSGRATRRRRRGRSGDTAPVGRLHADHAAQRGRLADRAAGVGAEGQRARSPAATAAALPPRRPARHPASGRAGCGSARTPSSRSSEPMANSSRLVLPTTHGARRRAAGSRRWRRTAGASPRGSATSRWSGRRGCTGCP